MSKEVAQVSRLLPAIVAGGLLALAVIDPALAHDCSSPADCEQTAGYNGTVSLVGGLIGIISTLIGGQIGGIVSGLRPGAGGTTPGTGAGPSDGTGGGAAVAPPTEAPIVDPWSGKPLVTWKPGQFGPDQDGNPGGPGDVWWGGRWLPPGEVRERIADSLAADERRARQSADFAADSQRKSDEWMKGRTAELQRQAADEARQRAAQNTLDQIRNIARNRGLDDIWERTQGGPAFRPDGTLDPDYVERLRGSLRGRIRDDMHAPLPDEPSSPLSDFVSSTFNDARHNPIVRIGTGILSGGTSEIAFQSGAAWDAMQQAAAEAGRKGRDIDFTDAFRAGMKQFGRENLPLDTIEALRDPKAGWTDIVLAGASDLFTGYDVASTARNLRGSISAARGGAGIGEVLTHQADPLSLWGKGDDPARWPGLKEPDDLLNASSGRASGGPADLGDLAKDSVEGGRSVRRPGMPEPEHLPSSAVERGTHVRNTLRDEGIREGLVERMGYEHGTPGRYGLTTKAGGQPAQGSVFDEAFGTDATSVRTTARHELDHVQQFDQLQTQGKPGGPRENWINPDGSLTKEAGRQMELEVRMNELDRNLIERDAAIRRAGGDPADPSTWPPEARAAQREVDDARNAVDRLLQNQPIGSDSLGGSSLAKDAVGRPGDQISPGDTVSSPEATKPVGTGVGNAFETGFKGRDPDNPKIWVEDLDATATTLNRAEQTSFQGGRMPLVDRRVIDTETGRTGFASLAASGEGKGPDYYVEKLKDLTRRPFDDTDASARKLLDFYGYRDVPGEFVDRSKLWVPSNDVNVARQAVENIVLKDGKYDFTPFQEYADHILSKNPNISEPEIADRLISMIEGKTSSS